MERSIQQLVWERINGEVPGWCCSRSDFSDLGSRVSISQSLSRLERGGKLMSPLRGYYCIPRYSKLLGERLPPDYGKLAEAIARDGGWTILPCGDILLNEMGLSTQVPVVWNFVSTGPYRDYDVEGVHISFKHTANRELFSMSQTSAKDVQALKSIGAACVTDATLKKLRSRLSAAERQQLLSETSRVTSWIFECVKCIAREDSDA